MFEFNGYTGKNYDHRKVWMEELLQYMAQYFGLDIVSHSIMSNHFHIILRKRDGAGSTASAVVGNSLRPPKNRRAPQL